MKGHKYRDWLPFGSSTMFKMKRIGQASNGSQTPPKHGRRTVPHQKHAVFPGMRKPVTR